MIKCPQCGFVFDPYYMNEGMGATSSSDERDSWINYSGHADTAAPWPYTTEVSIKTRDEVLYGKNKQMLLKLIEEINKEEIPRDLKSRLVDVIKGATENPLASNLIVAILLKIFDK